MKKYRFLGKGLAGLLLGSVALASCNDDDTLLQRGETSPLQITVSTDKPASRAVITDEYLPDGSNIGVSLYNADGGSYDSQGYTNIKFTAAGTGASQVWSAGNNTPTLSGNPATVIAYYPWQDVADLSFVPVETATQTDYMYSKPLTGIVNTSPDADITLYHALTAVRVKLVLGDYTGSVDVSNVSVASPALGTAAMLDVYGAEGALTNVQGQGNAVALDVDFDLTAEGTSTDIMLVPDASVTTGTTTLAVTVGGKKYNAGIDFDTEYLQGYVYTYTLTLDNTGMKVTKIAVTQWQEGTNEEEELQPGKDNKYVVKIVASYSAPGPASYIEEDGIAYNNNSSIAQSRSGETFYFHHNLSSEFVGTIDWGDGTVETYTEESINSTKGHSYPNDGQEYIITVKGNIVSLKAFDDSFYQCLKEIIHIGKDCGITSFDYAFAYCENLTTIPAGMLDHCTEVTSFDATFADCESLTTIPAGLFDNCTEVTTFSNTFSGCESLTAIPEGLFDKCTKVTSFYASFKGTGITSIPSGLFDNCTEVTDFGGTFWGCTALQTIPEGLFDNCTEVTTFSAEDMGVGFISCSPGLFAQCKNLQSIPEGLFENCTKVTNFEGMFYNCDNLQTIPEGLFDNCTEVTDFSGAFEDCDNLQTIPVGLFDKNTKVTDFEATFFNCKSLTGESPYTVIQVDGVDTKVHLYERSAYPDVFTAPTSHNYCFGYCKGLSDYTTISTSYSSWEY